MNDQLAPVFAALGDRRRLDIVTRLADQQAHSIADLGKGLPLTRQAVRKHLSVLERAGLVGGERVGRQHLFRARLDTFAAAKGYLDRISAQWDDAIGRLQAHIEKDDGPTAR